jgi:hypothetical protein
MTNPIAVVKNRNQRDAKTIARYALLGRRKTKQINPKPKCAQLARLLI